MTSKSRPAIRTVTRSLNTFAMTVTLIGTQEEFAIVGRIVSRITPTRSVISSADAMVMTIVRTGCPSHQHWGRTVFAEPTLKAFATEPSAVPVIGTVLRTF